MDENWKLSAAREKPIQYFENLPSDWLKWNENVRILKPIQTILWWREIFPVFLTEDDDDGPCACLHRKIVFVDFRFHLISSSSLTASCSFCVGWNSILGISSLANIFNLRIKYLLSVSRRKFLFLCALLCCCNKSYAFFTLYRKSNKYLENHLLFL